MPNALNLNYQEKKFEEKKFTKNVVLLEKHISKTIENEQKNCEDRNRKIAERLKRGKMRGKKLILEKEEEINKGKKDMKKRVKVFEDAFALKGNCPFNKIYIQYNTNG